MSDQERRALERAATEGDPGAAARALTARRRLGTLTLESLEWAAYVGDAGARLALTAERPLCTCDMGGKTHGRNCELVGHAPTDRDYRIPPGLWKWIRHLPNERQIIARVALAIAELAPMTTTDPGAEEMLEWAAAARAWLEEPGDEKARALKARERHAPHVLYGARCPMPVRDRAQDLRVVSQAILEIDAARGLTRLADRAVVASKLPGRSEQTVRALVGEVTLPWIFRDGGASSKKTKKATKILADAVVRTGVELERVRVELDVSPLHLATALGLREEQLARIEKDRKKLGPDLVLKIDGYLKKKRLRAKAAKLLGGRGRT